MFLSLNLANTYVKIILQHFICPNYSHCQEYFCSGNVVLASHSHCPYYSHFIKKCWRKCTDMATAFNEKRVIVETQNFPIYNFSKSLIQAMISLESSHPDNCSKNKTTRQLQSPPLRDKKNNQSLFTPKPEGWSGN